MLHTARDFFRVVVLGNYDDCRGRASDVRLAMNFAVSALALCDWTFADYQGLGAERVRGSRRAYTKWIRSHPDEYDLVCDIADSWKHSRLSRSTARVSIAQQVHSDQFRAGDPCGLALDMLVVTTNAGERKPLEPLFGAVLQLWTQELHDLEELMTARSG